VLGTNVCVLRSALLFLIACDRKLLYVSSLRKSQHCIPYRVTYRIMVSRVVDTCCTLQAETEVATLTKRVRALEEDFEATDARLVQTQIKLEQASKAADDSERSLCLLCSFTVVGLTHRGYTFYAVSWLPCIVDDEFQ